MDYSKEKLELYEKEAKERFGDTEAWREYEKKKIGVSDAAEGLMAVFRKFGEQKEFPPHDPFVQNTVSELQRYISDNYYTCTDEILLSLGETYVSDGRFKSNIDKVGGDGTANFVFDAVKVYCENRKK